MQTAWIDRLLGPRNITAAVHLGFAGVLLLRPHLFELLEPWRGFLTVMPQTWWMVSTLVVAAMLVASPRGSKRLLVAQFISATLYITISGVISAPSGINTGSSTYLILGAVTLLMLARTGVQVLASTTRGQHLLAHPPAWARRWFGSNDDA